MRSNPRISRAHQTGKAAASELRRLHAVSHELLAVLEECANELEEATGTYSDGSCWGIVPTARAAIAKATGGAV